MDIYEIKIKVEEGIDVKVEKLIENDVKIYEILVKLAPVERSK